MIEARKEGGTYGSELAATNFGAGIHGAEVSAKICSAKPSATSDI